MVTKFQDLKIVTSAKINLTGAPSATRNSKERPQCVNFTGLDTVFLVVNKPKQMRSNVNIGIQQPAQISRQINVKTKVVS